ncbi:MAG: hypothetical protein A2Z30_08670 [Chloroflexi bacterium RBG_16_64_43]|nr:MAG: hypothetical protein A2Z30_08670 [Chloroflexi bacterium RBG_16_64_43]
MLGFAAYLLLTPLVLFLAGGEAAWLAAWVYFVLAIVAVIGSRLIALKVSPEMLVERSRFGEAQGVPTWDRLLGSIVALAGPLATLVVAGLDHRFRWPPHFTVTTQVAGGVVLALAYTLSTWAFLSNRFFSAVVRIQAERGHQVVRSGPYAIVRHPAYAGGILAMLVTPLMLDAAWSIVPAACVVAAMVARTALEDRMLQDRLQGYREYCTSVRFRLIPGVW